MVERTVREAEVKGRMTYQRVQRELGWSFTRRWQCDTPLLLFVYVIACRLVFSLQWNKLRHQIMLCSVCLAILYISIPDLDGHRS